MRPESPTPPREASCASCGSADPAERRLMFHAPENRCTDHFHDEPCPECGCVSGHKESCPGYFGDDPLHIPKIAVKVRLPQVEPREASFEEALSDLLETFDSEDACDVELAEVEKLIIAAHARELAAANAPRPCCEGHTAEALFCSPCLTRREATARAETAARLHAINCMCFKDRHPAEGSGREDHQDERCIRQRAAAAEKEGR